MLIMPSHNPFHQKKLLRKSRQWTVAGKMSRAESCPNSGSTIDTTLGGSEETGTNSNSAYSNADCTRLDKFADDPPKRGIPTCLASSWCWSVAYLPTACKWPVESTRNARSNMVFVSMTAFYCFASRWKHAGHHSWCSSWDIYVVMAMRCKLLLDYSNAWCTKLIYGQARRARQHG